MDFNDYQWASKRTIDPTQTELEAYLNFALGVAGEAGEVAEHFKKTYFHGKQIPDRELFLELGDIMWYIAAICTRKGWKLEDVAEANVQKLLERHPDGFKKQKSDLKALAEREQ